MRCAYKSLGIAAISFLLLSLLSCGPSVDYRGPVTLIVSGRSAYRELVISMNGNENLPVGELDRPAEKKFTFENAKNGKNHMVLKVVFADGEIKEKPYSFNALPGAVIKVVVNVRWSFGATIDADVITLAEGVDPAVIAAAAAAQDARKRRRGPGKKRRGLPRSERRRNSMRSCGSSQLHSSPTCNRRLTSTWSRSSYLLNRRRVRQRHGSPGNRSGKTPGLQTKGGTDRADEAGHSKTAGKAEGYVYPLERADFVGG